MNVPQNDFVLEIFGFFIYLVKENKCAKMIVPKSEVVPHVCVLRVPRSAKIDGQLTVGPWPDDNNSLAVGLDGLSLHMVTLAPEPAPAPANLERRPAHASRDAADFDWVPDFSQVCCGIKLNDRWEETSAFQSLIFFNGGKLKAEPDGNTQKRTWSWPLCDGSAHTQRVTTKTSYTVPMATSLNLRFDNISTKTPVATVSLPQPTTQPTLINVPTELWNERGAPGRKLVEYSHLQSTLRLCVPGSGQLSVPEKTAFPPLDPAAPPELLSRVPFVDRHDGTPECSGSQFLLP